MISVSVNRDIYEILRKNMVQPDKPWLMYIVHVLCWITKATDTQDM
jgi:hypothetical protein